MAKSRQTRQNMVQLEKLAKEVKSMGTDPEGYIVSV